MDTEPAEPSERGPQRPVTRRRPRRRTERAAVPSPAPAAAPGYGKPPAKPAPPAKSEPPDRSESLVARPPRAERNRAESPDRQWRELAGAGRTQLTLGAALRARDADRPSAAELAEAEQTVAIQHRNWVPAKDG